MGKGEEMKKLILTFALLFVVGLTAFATPVFGATVTEKNIEDGVAFCKAYPITLQYNGSTLQTEAGGTPPVVITPDGNKNGWTLIPARTLFESAGADVTWNEANQAVTVTYDDTEILLTIGASAASVNGASKNLDLPALIIDHDGDYYGSTMIPVRFVAETLGFGVAWEDATRTVKVTKEATSDNNKTNPGQEPNRGDRDDTDTDTDTDTDVTVDTDMGVLPQASDETAEKIIVIDAGHGGKDVGATGDKGKSSELHEKEVNLKVALLLEKYLKAAGIKAVEMTRDDDTYVGLYDRPAFANELGADFFISVHNNSNDYPTPNGTEVHYYSKVDAEGHTEEDLYGIGSKTVAAAVQKEMLTYVGAYDRKIKSSPALAVLNKTVMPAIVVEGAFMSNANDLSLIRSEDYAKKYAFACAKGIILSMNEAFGN